MRRVRSSPVARSRPVSGARQPAVTQSHEVRSLAPGSRGAGPSALSSDGATRVVDPVTTGVRRPDAAKPARLFTPAALAPAPWWSLAGMPSTCASARRRPCAARRSSCASGCRPPLPPSSCRARRPAGRFLDRLDGALYGNELALERALLVPQRVQDSALRHRDLLSSRRPARITCPGRRHARIQERRRARPKQVATRSSRIPGASRPASRGTPEQRTPSTCLILSLPSLLEQVVARFASAGRSAGARVAVPIDRGRAGQYCIREPMGQPSHGRSRLSAQRPNGTQSCSICGEC